MIVTIFITITLLVLGVVLDILPSIPAVPVAITNTINSVLDFIFNGLDLISLFIRPSTLVIGSSILIILLNFDIIYHFIIFIVGKIPFLKSWRK